MKKISGLLILLVMTLLATSLFAENNFNELFNEIGLTKRATCKENMIPMETLGKFVLSWRGLELKVGGGKGLTQALRKEYWEDRKNLIGKKLTFYYQKHGMKDLPRIANFKGIRRDL